MYSVNNELFIRSSSEAVDFALLKVGNLIELHKEEEKSNFHVGDIFIAKIRKPVAGLNAAFVNVGFEKDAFLHYHDLGPNLASQLKFIKLVSAGKIKDFSLKNFQFEKEIDKDGSITEIINANQSILVQVVKEPISTKGPRISAELSLAGRFIVLVPFSDRVSISQKIEDKKRKRTFETTRTSRQTKRIWCYCSHSSRRQKHSRIRKRFAEPHREMDCNV
jgi:ribonuclease G